MMHYDDESSTTPQVLAARPSLMRALNEQMLLEQIRRFESVSRSDLTAVSGCRNPRWRWPSPPSRERD